MAKVLSKNFHKNHNSTHDQKSIQVKKIFAGFSLKNFWQTKTNFIKFKLFATFRSQDMTI